MNTELYVPHSIRLATINYSGSTFSFHFIVANHYLYAVNRLFDRDKQEQIEKLFH